MAIDIKAKIEEIAKKIASDKELQEMFQKEPTKAVEKLLGVDLPDDLVNQIIEGVKARISLEKVGDALGALGGLFGKK